VNSLRVIVPDLPYEIVFNEWSRDFYMDTLMPDVELRTMPVNHRLPCCAYSLTLHRRGRFDIERAKKQNIPLAVWSRLQKQPERPVTHEGNTYTSDMVLGPPRRGLTVGYCTDTRPVRDMPAFFYEADLLVLEGLYGEDDKQDKVVANKHMSFREAATVARQAKAKELWLTHFSPAMPEPRQFREAATAIFPNTVVARDRLAKTLNFEDEE
jgi:ribonuclease Z